MRVALRTPIAGKLGEEFDRVFDRLLAPRLYNEPLLPPFPPFHIQTFTNGSHVRQGSLIRSVQCAAPAPITS